MQLLPIRFQAAVTTEIGALNLAAGSSSADSDQDRQAAWEGGRIDYMGADSWQNIQARIEATLAGHH